MIEELVKRIARLERRLAELETRENILFNASNISSGTLSTDRYSAFADLQAENKIGLVTGRVPSANQVRFYDPASEAHDFTSTTLPSGWSWAGSPFVTPTLSVVNGTFLQVQPGTGRRSFMFRNTLGTPLIFGVQSAATGSSYIVWRLDDGTDNNYIEIGLCDTALSDKQVIKRVRTGGGTPSVTVDARIFQPDLFWLRVSIFGTQWSSWSLISEIYLRYSYTYQAQSATVSFTPTRFGVCFYTVDSWMLYLLDGIN